MPTEAIDQSAYELLHRGALTFAAMSAAGLRVDVPRLERTLRTTERKIERLKRELAGDEVWRLWRKLYGKQASLTKKEQLRRVLYTEMGLPCHVWTEGGKSERRLPSVDKNALALLRLPFTTKYNEIMELTTVRNTFLTGIQRELVGDYIHPNYLIHSVRTYRSSSTEPNAHNFPKRNEGNARLVRSLFIPRGPDYVRVGIDFKGIEVAVSACYNKDPVLIKYVSDPKSDMHGDMACQIFMLEPEQLDRKKVRHCSKNQFVFPQFYGSVYFQCAPAMWNYIDLYDCKVKDTDESIRKHLRRKGIKELGACNPDHEPIEGTFEYHLKQIEEDFWGRRFRVYAQWKKDWWYEYLKKGYYDTYTGFRIHGHSGKGQFVKRNNAINDPVQNSAFNCLLWCANKMHDWLKKRRMKSVLVSQIHDSLDADVHRSELQDYLNKVIEVTTVDLPRHWKWIIVPMVVEVEVSEKNWFEMEAWGCVNETWGPKVED